MESSDERWVEERLAALDGERAWQPDAGRAWTRMRRRDGDLRVRRAGWFGATAASLAAALLLMLIANPQACANPIECVNETAPAGYKLIGPAAAPVTVEFYSDYQCHPCAAALAALEESARAGKIRILLRDLPMPEHRYSRAAARYANSAGALGYYEAAARQIFATERRWSQDGDIDGQLAPALPPAVMEQVRRMVRLDRTLDDTLAADLAMARKDGVEAVPSAVEVVNGRRSKIDH